MQDTFYSLQDNALYIKKQAYNTIISISLCFLTRSMCIYVSVCAGLHVLNAMFHHLALKTRVFSIAITTWAVLKPCHTARSSDGSWSFDLNNTNAYEVYKRVTPQEISCLVHCGRLCVALIMWSFIARHRFHATLACLKVSLRPINPSAFISLLSPLKTTPVVSTSGGTHQTNKSSIGACKLTCLAHVLLCRHVT